MRTRRVGNTCGALRERRGNRAGRTSSADGPEEAGNGGFERFGWGPALLDDEASRFISQAFHRADAILFGRRTYKIFVGSSAPGQLTPFNNRRLALTTCLRQRR